MADAKLSCITGSNSKPRKVRLSSHLSASSMGSVFKGKKCKGQSSLQGVIQQVLKGEVGTPRKRNCFHVLSPRAKGEVGLTTLIQPYEFLAYLIIIT